MGQTARYTPVPSTDSTSTYNVDNARLESGFTARTLPEDQRIDFHAGCLLWLITAIHAIYIFVSLMIYLVTLNDANGVYPASTIVYVGTVIPGILGHAVCLTRCYSSETRILLQRAQGIETQWSEVESAVFRLVLAIILQILAAVTIIPPDHPLVLNSPNYTVGNWTDYY